MGVINEFPRKPVQFFYGIGGIGKTYISKRIIEFMEDNSDNIVLKIDFSIPEHREKSHALSFLKYQLSAKYNIKLPAFEMAYLHYWHKTQPYSPILREDIPYLDEVDLTNDILRDYFSLDSNSLKQVSKDIFEASEEIPWVRVLPKLIKATHKLNRAKNDVVIKRKNKHLSKLIAKDASEILKYLPEFFAQDLIDYLKENGEKNCYIFIDTYENLWTGQRGWGSLSLKDHWIRELIKLTPGVQWFICGRDNVPWKKEDEYWEGQLNDLEVLEFSELESKEYLIDAGVLEPEIQSEIISTSKVPENLRLSALRYHQLREQFDATPSVEEFEKIPNDLFERFENYLQKAERDTLFTLAVPRFWNKEMFLLLTKELSTGLNIFDYRSFVDLSFVKKRSQGPEEEWVIEKSLRKAALEHLSNHFPETIPFIQETLILYYKEKLTALKKNFVSMDSVRKIIFEYLYLLKSTLSNQELLQVFLVEIKEILTTLEDDELTIALYEEVITEVHEQEGRVLGVAYADLSALYEHVGNFSLAESLLRKALDLSDNPMDQVKLKSNLASLLTSGRISKGKLEEATRLYKESINELLSTNVNTSYGGDLKLYLEIKEGFAVLQCMYPGNVQSKQNALNIFQEIYQLKKANDYHLESLMNTFHNLVMAKTEKLALISSGLQGIKEKVSLKEDYKSVLKTYTELYGLEDERVAFVMSSFGDFYWSLGSRMSALSNFRTRAFHLFKKAAEIYEASNDYNSLVELARVYHSLGQYYIEKGLYENAIEFYEKATDGYDEYYGPLNEESANVLNDVGVIYMHEKKYKSARLKFEEAMAINESLYPDEPSKTAVSKINLGHLYGERGAYRKAVRTFRDLSNEIEETDSHYIEILRHYKNYHWLKNRGTIDKKFEEIELEIKRVVALKRKGYGVEDLDSAGRPRIW